MNRIFVSLLLLVMIAGCALRQVPDDDAAPAVASGNAKDRLAPFSAGAPGGLPSGWEPVVILRTKKPTHYQLVAEQERTVLHAKAVGASSGLMQHVSIDPLQQPWLTWQWKIAGLVKTADNFHGATEDSPVRIVLGFDGDKDTLPFADQVLFDTAKLITGHDFPYATMMYIWENKAPVGTVIANSRSKRIQKVVAASGPDGIGQWKNFTRNIVEDYERAFGEKPGRLIGVGVLTDTDNTGETVEAWYGDIRVLRERM
ncbi:DUF3047 domain-containing protein [Noviherbaspirillum cavernae]|uniref:DUF3047 domain-containing protein n=1 Tax=Noviherbaspirillum cavernae TaxID=2320862 RepID=A0A418X402_9BURK|nr:DUF3047 domain-containing protein [Noviherbaspirillum cavernae]RJG07192.1 DUF3047 domain-containing protein [Noviherbaspirillum cavernae]